ncbi:uncharacterized membrane protein YidH (DUF202 family) [Flavobacterium sp. CG_23.5]|uniref:hypothetical protein n=1 Tax=unclassified Flavobacterium TaxID=196869 RepID=UPI0018CBAEE3|nr:MULTISPECIES: hypothetical protein [unclassified Flavobacterium]MBG6111609.1 uncharacterized membrane protein YidH (DUF202 family) [Flavobacterium sp. CG_9.10]MBP2282298.1 uncharacterized membrane protein YidH (DUF202 family) [Flavobacterium sp. CG_23.5]
MQLKNLGIVLLIIGIAMMAYTGFNYVTTEKVVDIGPIQVNKQVNHPVQWSPIIGIVLAVGGVVLLVSSNKRS